MCGPSKSIRASSSSPSSTSCSIRAMRCRKAASSRSPPRTSRSAPASSQAGSRANSSRARPKPAGTAADQRAERTTPGKALLVEDNPEVLQVSRALLEQLGYRVEAVSDARAALQAVDQGQFDIVLSDIVMAGTMNGLGLAREI